MRLARHYWPALLAAVLVTAAAGIGWRHTLQGAAHAAQATADVAWPLLWLAGPGLLILTATWLAVRARRRWQHGLPLRGTWLATGFGALVVCLVLGSILLFPALLVDNAQQRLPTSQPVLSAEQRLKAETDARTSLLQAIAGLVVLVGAGATWRQLHINREGQVTDRFTRAIDQLGSQYLEVRLGGIYALGRIASDSKPTVRRSPRFSLPTSVTDRLGLRQSRASTEPTRHSTSNRTFARGHPTCRPPWQCLAPAGSLSRRNS
jgi:hypothetical protein